MNRQEHLLIILSEECQEVAQQASKALRFGIDEQRDLPTSNRERLIHEFNDLMAVVEMLKQENIDLGIDLTLIQNKKNKVEKYLKYSKELGTLD